MKPGSLQVAPDLKQRIAKLGTAHRKQDAAQ